MAKLKTRNGTTEHKVVSEKAWLTARRALLAKEKKFSEVRDRLNRQRRNLPWVKVEKEYVFDGPEGKETLAALFGGMNQLIVYHFMFGPAWTEGCPHCSFWADHFDGTRIHLGQRDRALAVISRAPLLKLEAFEKRMGWKVKWLSSFENDFNFDYHVSFTPEEVKKGTLQYNFAKTKHVMEEQQGVSAFYKDDHGHVFHTYSAHARGIDLLNTTYNFLDLTAKGRNENPTNPQEWVRHHDQYDD